MTAEGAPAAAPGTDAGPSGSNGIVDRLRPLVRRIGPLRLAAIAIALVAIGYLWIRSDGRFAEATVWTVPLVLMLLAVSLPWRTISAGLVARFFFIGFGPVFFAMVATQFLLELSPLHRWLGDLSGDLALSNFGSLGGITQNVWAPITEEIWKIVPLLVLLRWGRSHLRTQGGPLDFALLAGATGAGMGLAEDLLHLGGLTWSTPDSPLLGLGVGTAYIALVASPLNRFQFDAFDLDFSYEGIVGILNPSVEELANGSVWAGHGALPAFVGLAIGFAILGRRRYGRVSYVLPLLVLLWAIWDHFIGNWYSSVRCSRVDAPTLCGLSHVDLTGALLPLVAIAAWLLATLVTQRQVARRAAADPGLALARAQVSSAAYRNAGGLWPLRLAVDVVRFLRLRTRYAIGWYQLERAPEDGRARDAESLAAARIEVAAIAARLRNQPLPAMSAAARHRVDRLIDASS